MSDLTSIILNGTEYSVGGEGGISAVAQALLINILRNATYITDQSTNITNLETELASGGGTTRVAIINTLTNCTTNNSASSITVGSAYIATITANEGYDIESASVLMGGQDVTASVYAAGVITIPNVTGTLVITVTAAEQSETGLAHYWKLTTGSIIDTIDGETELTVGANTAVTAGIGATIDAANDFITVPFTYRTYSKIKIKFGAMTNNGSGSERLIGIKYGASSTPAIALRYDNSNMIWENASNTYATAFTAADAFANNELVLERNASDLGKAIDITFGADAVISGFFGGFEYNYVDIGGSSGSGFYTVIVESIKVYT